VIFILTNFWEGDFSSTLQNSHIFLLFCLQVGFASGAAVFVDQSLWVVAIELKLLFIILLAGSLRVLRVVHAFLLLCTLEQLSLDVGFA